MKNIIILSIIFLSFLSCQVTEEMMLNKDGSGEYRIGIDMSATLKTVNSMKGEMDSLKLRDQKQKLSKKIDSFIPITDFLSKAKDSIELTKEEEKVLKEMKDLSVHINIDEEAGIMKVEYIYPYKKVSQLNNFFQNLKTINAIEKRYKGKDQNDIKKDGDVIGELSKFKINYSFRNKVFKRKTQIEETNEKDDEKTNNNADKLSEMFQYQIIYHFPSPIKEVNYEGEATMSIDRKTLFINVPLDKFDKNRELLNFEIILE